jgi:O-succinylbenzoic acid--CoA ligase
MKIHQNNETITSTDLIQTIDNKIFKWIGRNDFVINSGGVKIIPELLENSISVRFNLKVIIVVIPDVTFGEKAILVSETPLDDALKMKLKGHIETEFGKYYVPKDFIQLSFEYINELKLDRRRLTAKVKAHYE